MLYTLKHVAEFCYEHQRRRDVDGKIIFRDLKEWGLIVVQAAKRNTLYTVENPKRELIGVCIAIDKPATGTLWVSEIVCLENAFPTFVREATKRFPGYRIQGNRGRKSGRKTITYTHHNLWAATNLV